MDQLAENRKRQHRYRSNAKYLLQGVLACEQCGYVWCGQPGKRSRRSGRYYRCLGMDSHRFSGQCVCDMKQIRADRLKATVWADVCKMLADPHRVEQEYERRLSQTSDDRGSDNPQQLQGQIQQVKRGISRITDAYEEGWLDKCEYERRMGRARDRLEQLEVETRAHSPVRSRHRCHRCGGRHAGRKGRGRRQGKHGAMRAGVAIAAVQRSVDPETFPVDGLAHL